MHQHRHPESCPVCQPWPDWARHLAAHLNRIEGIAMTSQADIDNLTTEISTATDQITTEIATLQASNPGVDTSALRAAADKLKALGDTNAPAPTPAPAAQTLYAHVGGNAFDPAVWPDSGQKAADGSTLYTFTGDGAPGDQNGASAEWVVTPAAPTT